MEKHVLVSAGWRGPSQEGSFAERGAEETLNSEGICRIKEMVGVGFFVFLRMVSHDIFGADSMEKIQ